MSLDIEYKNGIVDKRCYDEKEMRKTSLQEFYAGQSIFITGGTGFLGKALLQKLLRCCPDISCIFLLMRSKKGKSVTDRISELFDDPAFDNLTEKKTEIKNKIIGISGDCSLSNIGISVEDRDLLINKATIVIHIAATVRFTEKLNVAVPINLESTATILNLCKNMKNLKSFIYVSTTYSNCFTSNVEEKFYDYSIQYQQLLNIVRSMPEDILNRITPELIRPWPNTYCFTKAMAENMIKTENEGLPMGIFRPGIVVGAINEPKDGWIDNTHGPTAIIMNLSLGIMRLHECDRNAITNMVPVDFVTNALIASVRDVALQTNRRDKEMLIYNFTSTVEAPVKFEMFFNTVLKYMNTCPMPNTLWYCILKMNKHKYVCFFYKIFLHWVPALLMDSVSYCTGGNPRMRTMYKKIHKLINLLSYFCVNEWTFENRNTMILWSRLDLCDKKLFPFSMKNFDWEPYLYNYAKGIKMYLFKEVPNNEKFSNSKSKRLYLMHQLLKISLLLLGCWFFWIIYAVFFSN